MWGHDEHVESTPELDAQYFDSWYADMVASPVKDEIQQRHLGLPPHLLSTSLLSWEGIADVVAALRLRPGDTLLDLACGRGGYGLEIAARTGAQLVGIDFSAEAVRQAGGNARRAGQVGDFRVGDLTATGLDAGSLNGVICIDAIQFTAQPDAAFGELRRVMAAGGRAVLTCWEPVTRHDERLPDRLRRIDLGAGLGAAGFEHVEVMEMSAWSSFERAMWEEAVAMTPGADRALQSFHGEGVRVLDTLHLMRRVMASATAPG